MQVDQQVKAPVEGAVTPGKATVTVEPSPACGHESGPDLRYVMARFVIAVALVPEPRNSLR